MKYSIDSYAWIEYFMGTKAGMKAKPIIEGLDEKVTPTICFAEIYAKALKVGGQDLAERQREFIKGKSALIPLDERIALESARIDVTMKGKVKGWGLADSIVYATGLVGDAHTVTGDEHFRNLQNIVFI